ncbi:hypothetical protein RMSM_01073 [Rhodopirellula maiorica SM1]|uniref:Uncharacterized protein n=2 Tax=Novipirellula TaxID=2795426 RepID=M5RS13_9BACT|nr:hypothetical protein RMSM_01073 [Rhodopirellula maiorica SM1]
MVGPAVPVAASYEVMEALTSVQVTVPTEGASAFDLTFELSNRSPLHTLFLLAGGAGIPILRVVLVATLNGTPNVLIDGVMTNHEVSPGNQGKATMSIKGDDLSVVMDHIDLSGIPYPAMPIFTRVAAILAKYAPLGVIPKVIPNLNPVPPNPLDRIPRQQGTDLQYIQMLAKQVGYTFYMEPGPKPGTSFGYWGPLIKTGPAQPALTTNMDAHTNVESLSFRFNSNKKMLPIVLIQEPFTKLPIPIPIGDVGPLNPPLGAIPPIPHKIKLLKQTAKMSFAEAAEAGLGEASRSSDVVSASGSLDVLRYGRILQPRKLVGVRGAGHAFDGLYYVETVTHKIKRGEYKQDFTLSRNGLVSTVGKVPA